MQSAKVQPQTTPEMEEEILIACRKKTSAPLSEVLQQLILGISDETFGKEFIEKIAQAEEKTHTWKYVDHWENGQLKIKAYFKEGKVDGHVHGWFSDGEEAFKAFFYENTKAGIHLAFYPSETPRLRPKLARLFSYNFKGQLDGEQKTSEYHDELKTFTSYKHGVLHGTKCMYNQEHQCIKDEF